MSFSIYGAGIAREENTLPEDDCNQIDILVIPHALSAKN